MGKDWIAYRNYVIKNLPRFQIISLFLGACAAARNNPGAEIKNLSEYIGYFWSYAVLIFFSIIYATIQSRIYIWGDPRLFVIYRLVVIIYGYLCVLPNRRADSSNEINEMEKPDRMRGYTNEQKSLGFHIRFYIFRRIFFSLHACAIARGNK